MNIGEIKTIEANTISNDLAEKIYKNKYLPNKNINLDFVLLEKLCNVFSDRETLHSKTVGKKFTCYIEKKAYDSFVRFANDVYYCPETKEHEATGIIAGYYFKDKKNPESEFIVGTNFLPATGLTSKFACEISYEDDISFSKYCDEHKKTQAIFIHSHPYFEAFFSCGNRSDCSTLKTKYSAKHQIGVVDNLMNTVLGFKIYGNDMCEEDVYLFDLDKSSSTHLECKLLSSTRTVKNTSLHPLTPNCAKKNKEKQKKEITPKANNRKKIKIHIAYITMFTLFFCGIFAFFYNNQILFALFLFGGMAIIFVNHIKLRNLENRFDEFSKDIRQKVGSNTLF